MAKTDVRTPSLRRATTKPGAPRRRGVRLIVPLAIVVVGAGAIGLGLALRPHPPAPAPVPAARLPEAVPIPTVVDALPPAHQGAVTVWVLPTYGGPRDVVVDTDGGVWVTEADAARVDRFRDGELTRFQLSKVFEGSSSFRLAEGRDGEIWFTGYPDGSLGRILPDGTGNFFAAFATGQSAVSIVQAPDGAMWTTDPARGYLVRAGRDGIATQVPVPPLGSTTARPYDLVIGPDGAVWFTDPETGSIGRLDLGTGDIRRVSVGDPKSIPRSLLVGADGALWMTLSKDRTLVRYDPAEGSLRTFAVAASSSLNDLAQAPDGTFWITQDAPSILHVAVDGTLLDRVTIPHGAGKFADGIAVGADGRVWTVTVSGNTLVEIDPSAAT